MPPLSWKMWISVDSMCEANSDCMSLLMMLRDLNRVKITNMSCWYQAIMQSGTIILLEQRLLRHLPAVGWLLERQCVPPWGTSPNPELPLLPNSSTCASPNQAHVVTHDSRMARSQERLKRMRSRRNERRGLKEIKSLHSRFQAA